MSGLEITWQDNPAPKPNVGGTELNIKKDGHAINGPDGKPIHNKHYPADQLDAARKAVVDAVENAQFDNKPKGGATI